MRLTYYSAITLFSVMIVAACIPSISTLTVSARSISLGFIHGIFTTIGIVIGDILFILIAIYGLTVIHHILGDYFFLIHYLGGIYLIWLGFLLLHTRPKNNSIKDNNRSSLLSSLLSGLFITLADQKAILFYMGFLPAFLDPATATYIDTITIILLATFAIFIPKLSYAYLAVKAGSFFQNNRITELINTIAGAIMICVGIYLMVKT